MRLLAPMTANGLTITPIWDSTITSDPNAATIQATINSTIQIYQTTFSNPTTVTITFSEMSSGLGQNISYYNTISYTSFRSALVSHGTSANDATALTSVPNQSTNPVNGNASVNLTLPNLRTLGFTGSSYNPPAGQTDSTISLNTSLMNLTRSSINPSKYDLMAVASHEIDEVLGFGSALNGLSNGAPAPTTAIWALDLFRYDQTQTNVRSFNTTQSSPAYFALTGTSAPLARFNQTAGGDFSDWYSPGGQTPQVQDAFGTPGSTPNLSPRRARLHAGGAAADLERRRVEQQLEHGGKLVQRDALQQRRCDRHLQRFDSAHARARPRNSVSAEFADV